MRRVKRRGERKETVTDKQVLAHYRDRDQNPYMTMGTAKALHGLSMKFGYLARPSVA